MESNNYEFDNNLDHDDNKDNSLIPLDKQNDLRKSNFISLEFDFFIKKFKLKISKN